MSEDPRTLEQKAYDFLAENDHDKAFKSFRGAGEAYKDKGEHRQAAICFASAASSWALKLGEKTFYHAARAYELAAKEAEKDKDLKYAALLYKHAAVYYEKDMEFLNFSECFFRSKECYRKFLAVSLIAPQKAYALTPSEGDKGCQSDTLRQQEERQQCERTLEIGGRSRESRQVCRISARLVSCAERSV